MKTAVVGDGVSVLYRQVRPLMEVLRGSRFDDGVIDGPFIEDLQSIIIHDYQFSESITMNIEEIDLSKVFSKEARPPYLVDVRVTKIGDTRAYMIPVIDADTGRPITDWQAEFSNREVEGADRWQLRTSTDGQLHVSNLPWQRIPVTVSADGYGDHELILSASGYDGQPVRLTPLNTLYLYYDAELPVANGGVVYVHDQGEAVRLAELRGGAAVDTEEGPAIQFTRPKPFPNARHAVAFLLDDHDHFIAMSKMTLSPQRVIEARLSASAQQRFSLALSLPQGKDTLYWPLDRETGLPLSPKEPGTAEGAATTERNYAIEPQQLQWTGRPIDVYLLHPETRQFALVHSIEETPAPEVQVTVDLQEPALQWRDHVDSPWRSLLDRWVTTEETAEP